MLVTIRLQMVWTLNTLTVWFAGSTVSPALYQCPFWYASFRNSGFRKYAEAGGDVGAVRRHRAFELHHFVLEAAVGLLFRGEPLVGEQQPFVDLEGRAIGLDELRVLAGHAVRAQVVDRAPRGAQVVANAGRLRAEVC
jgi:hypothetical protein